MFDSDKCIAIIPARGGSKRVKDKNISIVAGRPLIEHTINIAKEAKLFSQIFVNSESEKILNLSLSCGVNIYRRSKDLSTDGSSVIEVVQDMIKSIPIDDDAIIYILLPTSPLRTLQDLVNMHKEYIKKSNKTVVSVTRFDTPIQLAQFVKNGKLMPVFEEEYSLSTKSTGHTEAYKFNECAVVNSAKGFMSQNNLIGFNSTPYIMPPERSITIDYPYQKDLVERMFEINKQNDC